MQRPTIFYFALAALLLLPFSEYAHGEGSWKEKWSQEPYVIEFEKNEKRLRQDYSVEHSIHRRVKIQKEEAKNLGQISLSYDADMEEIKDIDAFVVTCEGRRLKYKEIRDTAIYQDDPVYSNLRSKVIIFPEVNVGSVIDWQYTVLSKFPIEKGFWDSVWQVESVPAAHILYKISFPKNIKPKIVYYNNALKLKAREKEDETIYTWERRNVDRVKLEEAMPSADKVFPWVGITTLDSWESINEWYWGKFADKLHADTAIKKRVRKIVEGETDTLKKIDKIVSYLQDNMRYISLSGFYTWGPHLATEVFRNKYGDCEDQVCLFITMLKACGIKAMPALYRGAGDGRIYKELPMLNFNHVIACIEVNGKPYFVDPLVKGYRVGETPYFMQDASVFVVGEKGGSILTLPASKEEIVREVMNVKIKIESDGSAFKETERIFDKADSIEYKQAFKAMGKQEKDDYISGMESKETSGGKLVSFDWGDINNLQTPLILKIAYKIPHYVTIQNEYAICQPFPAERKDLFTAKERSMPIEFLYGDLTESHLVYEIPEDFEIISAPLGCRLKTRLAEYAAQVRVENNKIFYDTEYRNKKDSVPASGYPKIKEFYDNISKSHKQYIILKKKQEA